MLLSCCYRLPKGITRILTFYLTSIFQRVQNEKKKNFYSWDFNMNCFNYNEDRNIKYFYHKVFQLGFTPVMEKPTRVGKNIVIIIDNIRTNGVFDNNL